MRLFAIAVLSGTLFVQEPSWASAGGPDDCPPGFGNRQRGRPLTKALAVIGASAYDLNMSSQFDDLTKRIQTLSAKESVRFFLTNLKR